MGVCPGIRKPRRLRGQHERIHKVEGAVLVMTPIEVFNAYALETQRLSYPGVLVESLPHFLRHTPKRIDADAMITFADLPLGREDDLINEQIAHFSQAGRSFEWKVYALDRPADLRDRLGQRGFESGPVEIFMAYPLDQSITIADRFSGAEIRRIQDERGVRDLVSIQEKLYDRSFAWWGAELLDTLAQSPSSISLYGAYADGVAVGCARTTFPETGQFAGIYGGSVLPEYRGRGIYSALLKQRLQEARERGYPFLIVDAAPMSRPILEKKGFIPICETWPMRLPAAASYSSR